MVSFSLRCCSSVVERVLGKDEVVGSTPTSSSGGPGAAEPDGGQADAWPARQDGQHAVSAIARKPQHKRSIQELVQEERY